MSNGKPYLRKIIFGILGLLFFLGQASTSIAAGI